jgi:hypothetical protein
LETAELFKLQTELKHEQFTFKKSLKNSDPPTIGVDLKAASGI